MSGCIRKNVFYVVIQNDVVFKLQCQIREHGTLCGVLLFVTE